MVSLISHVHSGSGEDIVPVLDKLFHPSSVAFVGFTSNPTDWFSQITPQALVDFGFEGEVYLVSRSGRQLPGLHTFTSFTQVPEPIDLVICNIPARATPGLLEECVAKGVRFVHLITSGFSETGYEEGRELERRVAEIARRGGIRLVGPNCPGLYCPESRFSFSSLLPRESGIVGWFAQSGGHCIRFLRMATARGVRFSKAVAIGNAVDLDATAFMEYFGQDEATKVICCYVEGMRDGQRFLNLVQKASQVKPVIIHKGGHTPAGTRATASHTGSLAGNDLVWEALCQQANIIRVHSVEELVNTVLPFTLLPPLSGNKVAILGYGGGLCVQAADDCESAGLEILPFPSELRERLASFTPVANNSVRNPVDSQHLAFGRAEWMETVKLATGWEGVDMAIFSIASDQMPTPDEQSIVETMVDNIIAAREVCPKPAAVVLNGGISPTMSAAVTAAANKLCAAGFPVFSNLAGAAQALATCLHYYEVRRREQD
jgi:acyl-CoA synthetase (NDP forming)